MPAFHAILCVRDEADVLPQSLGHLLGWCDALHIYDTGSSDESWEIVQDFARRDQRVRPFATEPVVFDNDLRGRVFEKIRGELRHGDWVCRADADEFYHTPPPDFLRDAVRPHEGRVCSQLYEFVFTSCDLAAWNAGPLLDAERARPIEQRRTRYYVEPVAELRFCRYRRGMRWGRGHNFPFSPGIIALERIPVRHYRWRDPIQMAQRCALRSWHTKHSCHGDHWNTEDWTRMIVANNDPRLCTWRPGEPLPARRGAEHLFPWPKRAAQWLMYRAGVPAITDRFRAGWTDADRPVAIPEEQQRALAEQMALLRRRLAPASPAVSGPIPAPVSAAP